MIRDERGVPIFSLGVMIDITEMKQSEEKVAFLAYHDELTACRVARCSKTSSSRCSRSTTRPRSR